MKYFTVVLIFKCPLVYKKPGLQIKLPVSFFVCLAGETRGQSKKSDSST